MQGRSALQFAVEALRRRTRAPGAVHGHRPLVGLRRAVENHHPAPGRRAVAARIVPGARQRRTRGPAGLRSRHGERACRSAQAAGGGRGYGAQIQARQPQREPPLHADRRVRHRPVAAHRRDGRAPAARRVAAEIQPRRRGISGRARRLLRRQRRRQTALPTIPLQGPLAAQHDAQRQPGLRRALRQVQRRDIRRGPRDVGEGDAETRDQSGLQRARALVQSRRRAFGCDKGLEDHPQSLRQSGSGKRLARSVSRETATARPRAVAADRHDMAA